MVKNCKTFLEVFSSMILDFIKKKEKKKRGGGEREREREREGGGEGGIKDLTFSNFIDAHIKDQNEDLSKPLNTTIKMIMN